MRTETVTEFVAKDGSRFRNFDQCLSYERELEAIEAIGIPECPKLDDGEYFTHGSEMLMNVRRGLWKLVVEKYGESHPSWKGHKADNIHPMSGIGRVLDDAGNGPIEKAWRKLACYDFERGREYNQPYFVAHPNEAKEICA